MKHCQAARRGGLVVGRRAADTGDGMMKSIVMLKLKIEHAPHDELTALAALMRRGRNVAIENWLLRERGLPENPKQSAPSPRGGAAKHPSTKLYHAITSGAPNINPSVAAKLAAEAWSNLNAKVDWRRRAGEEGKPRRRMDAILDYEDRAPWYTGDDIPVLNKHAYVLFEEELHLVVSRLTRDATDEDLVLKLTIKGLSPSLKLLIRRVLAKELKFSDSSIRLKGDQWVWFWPIQIETEQSNRHGVLHLWPVVPDATSDRHSDRPFRTDSPDGRSWYVGDGRYLLAQTSRLLGLKKMIGYRYRNGLAKGHGRAKVDRAQVIRSQQLRNIRDEFRRKAISDILKQAHRHECGTIIYHEPTGPTKTKCWFDVVGLEFDWTRFATDLKNSAARRGISVETKKLKIADVLAGLKKRKEGAA
jgi:hypothetical protein